MFCRLFWRLVRRPLLPRGSSGHLSGPRVHLRRNSCRHGNRSPHHTTSIDGERYKMRRRTRRTWERRCCKMCDASDIPMLRSIFNNEGDVNEGTVSIHISQSQEDSGGTKILDVESRISHNPEESKRKIAKTARAKMTKCALKQVGLYVMMKSHLDRARGLLTLSRKVNTPPHTRPMTLLITYYVCTRPKRA